MQSYYPTTPFGRRPLTLDQVANQAREMNRPVEKTVQKYAVFNAIRDAKKALGLPTTALSLLEELIKFHLGKTLGGHNLVVYPSNVQIATRMKGVSHATIRRHLATLVAKGIIIRHDSPNGKRYPKKGPGGVITRAFGFDLGPLVTRAEEFEILAEEARAKIQALRLVCERVTLCRRDIDKIIAVGIENDVAAASEGQGASIWTEMKARFRQLVDQIPRKKTFEVLEPIAEALTELAYLGFKPLVEHQKTSNLNANAPQNERHIQISEPKYINLDLESGCREEIKGQPEIEVEVQSEPVKLPATEFQLSFVLNACPDIMDYAKGGVSSWRDLDAATSVVAKTMAISSSAMANAQKIMGRLSTAIVVAALLQRGAEIKSPGGYLRDLTKKADAGTFHLGPLLHSLTAKRNKAKYARAPLASETAAPATTTSTSPPLKISERALLAIRGQKPLFARGASSFAVRSTPIGASA